MDNEKLPPLTPEEERVIVRKGTEAPFSGKFDAHFEAGTYRCRRCGALLYRSESKFNAGCGWPAFDDEIPGAVTRSPDADGRRTEITCAGCGGHLGHVFSGEQLTAKNIRHCVNSVSLVFRPGKKTTEKAILAGGCFWGVEHHLGKAAGVIATRAGFTGGTIDNPSYKQVCAGDTGHYEAVEVTFDPALTSYEKILALFFQVHDFTQADGQGPDRGPQYRSAVFCRSPEQERAAAEMLERLEKMGYRVATKILPAGPFWPADDSHQRYYEKTGRAPYCHRFRKIF